MMGQEAANNTHRINILLNRTLNFSKKGSDHSPPMDGMLRMVQMPAIQCHLLLMLKYSMSCLNIYFENCAMRRYGGGYGHSSSPAASILANQQIRRLAR